MQKIFNEQPVSEDTVIGTVERNWYGSWRVWNVILHADGTISTREVDLGTGDYYESCRTIEAA